jgi:hypothetical protein
MRLQNINAHSRIVLQRLYLWPNSIGNGRAFLLLTSLSNQTSKKALSLFPKRIAKKHESKTLLRILHSAWLENNHIFLSSTKLTQKILYLTIDSYEKHNLRY